MTMETKTTLEESTIEGLQTLIRYNLDSQKGFQEVAKETDSTELASLFREIAQERGELATELQQHVEVNDEDPVEEGSMMAALHRTWIEVRNKLNGGSPYVILAEAERGEDTIKHAYEDVLKETAGSAVNDVLTRQYAKVKSAHDRVRDLRDAVKDL